MFLSLQVVTILLVAVTMGLALAHALELPGKLRLDQQTYLAVQTIYYPGFTIGGIGEPLALVALLGLLAVTGHEDAKFWWILVGADRFGRDASGVLVRHAARESVLVKK